MTDWTGIHWGYGAGLAICGLCRALVLPDHTADHEAWHRRISEQADRYVPPPVYGGRGG